MAVSRSLSALAAAATQKAFLQTTEDLLKRSGAELIAMSTSVAAEILTGASTSFAANFIMACLKSLLSAEESAHEIARSVSKLVEEPLNTGMEQLRVADSLEGASAAELRHKTLRYQQALSSLDRALSMADPDERPIVQLLRGLASARIPGAAREAIAHLREYLDYCTGVAERSDAAVLELEKSAIESAPEAEAIQADPISGLGAGGLVSMTVSERRIRKAALKSRARQAVQEAGLLRSSTQELWSTAKSIEILCEVLATSESRRKEP